MIIKALRTILEWRFLSELKINNGKMTVEIVRHLIDIDLKFIVILDLENNQISSQEVKVLALCENLCYLTDLSLKKNKIGNRGINYLSSAQWPHLKTLNLAHVGSTTQGLNYLRKKTLPEIKVLNYSFNIDKLGCLRTLLELDIQSIKL